MFRPFTTFRVRIIRLTRHIGLSVTGNGSSNDRPNKDKWQLAAKSRVSQVGYVIRDKFRYPHTAVSSLSLQEIMQIYQKYHILQKVY